MRRAAAIPTAGAVSGEATWQAMTVERYMAHLDELTGGIEPEYLPIESDRPGPRVFALAYRDLPEPGLLTAFTYGLSLADHPDWRVGRPELCLSVRSADLAWATAAARLVEALRGECPFSYGNTIDFGGPVSNESKMSEFVIFAPIALGREDAVGIDVGDPLPLNFMGLYPLHASERVYVDVHGLEPFWELDWDPYDVRRKPAA
jgi:hypothetical protein